MQRNTYRRKALTFFFARPQRIALWVIREKALEHGANDGRVTAHVRGGNAGSERKRAEARLRLCLVRGCGARRVSWCTEMGQDPETWQDGRRRRRRRRVWSGRARGFALSVERLPVSGLGFGSVVGFEHARAPCSWWRIGAQSCVQRGGGYVPHVSFPVMSPASLCVPQLEGDLFFRSGEDEPSRAA